MGRRSTITNISKRLVTRSGGRRQLAPPTMTNGHAVGREKGTMMTVQELRIALTEYGDEEKVPLDVVLPDLTYLVDALEQWKDIAEIFGRDWPPEVASFVAEGNRSL
jgi:hypothetical protein